MKTYYSALTQGFYIDSLHTEIPPGAVEIADSLRVALLDGQADGKVISSDIDGYPYLADPPPPTTEELWELAKLDRAISVSSITVATSSGRVFDGDEDAQNRMARAVAAAASLDETTEWKLADNTVVLVTVAELREALRLAGARQTELWMIASPE